MNYLGKTGLERIWSKIKAKLENKVDKVTGKGLSTNDYTTAEKTKLSGIATGANKTVIDTALSSTSTNPVQNKVINSALAGKSASSHTHSVASSTANGFMSSTDKKNLDKISNDSEWISVTNLNSNFKVYDNDESARPAYRKIGNTVFLCGEIATTKNLAKDTTYVMFTLPEGYRPSKPVKVICQSSGTKIWLLQIDIYGNVYLSRLRDGETSEAPLTSYWFPLYATFCI